MIIDSLGLTSRRPLLADPAAVPRQRHRRQRAVAARRRRLPRPSPVASRASTFFDTVEAGPSDLLLRGTGDLRHADRTPGRLRARHLVDALRDLRRRADAGRADRTASSRATASRSSRATGCRSARARRRSIRSTGCARPARSDSRCPASRSALLGDDGRPTKRRNGRGARPRPERHARLPRPAARGPTAPLADGWLHTGDVGHFDDDGYLVLVDRVKDMIIRGGENIYPKEIENVLYSHPEVLEAAVVGRPHDVLGEEPVAFVALSTLTRCTVATSCSDGALHRSLATRFRVRSSSSTRCRRTRSARSPSPLSGRSSKG